MTKFICEECKEDSAEPCSEFNKNLCDDCYTEHRVTVEHLFGLDGLQQVDDFLSKCPEVASV